MSGLNIYMLGERSARWFFFSESWHPMPNLVQNSARTYMNGVNNVPTHKPNANVKKASVRVTLLPPSNRVNTVTSGSFNVPMKSIRSLINLKKRKPISVTIPERNNLQKNGKIRTVTMEAVKQSNKNIRTKEAANKTSPSTNDKQVYTVQGSVTNTKGSIAQRRFRFSLAAPHTRYATRDGNANANASTLLLAGMPPAGLNDYLHTTLSKRFGRYMYLGCGHYEPFDVRCSFGALDAILQGQFEASNKLNVLATSSSNATSVAVNRIKKLAQANSVDGSDRLYDALVTQVRSQVRDFKDFQRLVACSRSAYVLVRALSAMTDVPKKEVHLVAPDLPTEFYQVDLPLLAKRHDLTIHHNPDDSTFGAKQLTLVLHHVKSKVTLCQYSFFRANEQMKAGTHGLVQLAAVGELAKSAVGELPKSSKRGVVPGRPDVTFTIAAFTRSL